KRRGNTPAFSFYRICSLGLLRMRIGLYAPAAPFDHGEAGARRTMVDADARLAAERRYLRGKVRRTAAAFGRHELFVAGFLMGLERHACTLSGGNVSRAASFRRRAAGSVQILRLNSRRVPRTARKYLPKQGEFQRGSTEMKIARAQRMRTLQQ